MRKPIKPSEIVENLKVQVVSSYTNYTSEELAERIIRLLKEKDICEPPTLDEAMKIRIYFETESDEYDDYASYVNGYIIVKGKDPDYKRKMRAYERELTHYNRNIKKWRSEERLRLEARLKLLNEEV